MKIRNIICAILIICSSSSFAKNLDKIILDDMYCCSLHAALHTISEEFNVKFSYDVKRLREIEFATRQTKKPLSLFLDQVCKKHKLKYYTDKNGVIQIVDKWYEIGEEAFENTSKHQGPSHKKDFTLSGKVIDKETREMLPFVAILVKGTTNGTTTNVDGHFSLQHIPSDTSVIEFRYIGYKPKTVHLSPTAKVKDITIIMETEVVNLEEIMVTAEKQDILQVSNSNAGMIKMSPKKLNTLPNLGEKDILRSYQLMPGISAANENSSGLYVRGGTPDQVLVLYDGFTVYNVEHMFGFFSAFNSNAIKDVQLYKGGFESKYGGRLASVVEITGKEGNIKEFNAAVDLSMMSMNAFVEFPIGDKTTTVLAVRRSWKSPLYSALFNQYSDDDGSSSGMVGRSGFGGRSSQETSSYFYDINGKVTFRPSKKDIIALSFYNGKDDLDNSIQPQMRGGGLKFPGIDLSSFSIESVDLTNWGNTGLSLKWSRQINDKLFLNTLLSYSNYFSVRERSTSGSFLNNSGESNSISRGINEDNNLKDFTAKADFEYKFNKINKFEFGFQSTYNDIDYIYSQNDTTTIIDRSTNGMINAIYLQDKISLAGDKLSFTPGIRMNYFGETEAFYSEPRFNFMYKPFDKLKFKGSIGTYYQFAKRVVREDIAEGSRDFWVLSDNKNLPVSYSNQAILGFSYETQNYLFDVEAFYKEMYNVTEYSLRIEVDREGIDYSENFFTGNGKAKGIDFLFQKKYGKLTGWLAYTLSQVTNNIPEFGEFDFYAAHDVTHEFKAVASYKLKNWDFSATWIYATGRPYTAPEGGYQLTLLDGSTADYINVSEKNGNRLPDYHRLDISANVNLMLGNVWPVRLGFSIFNLYNRANVWYNEYEIIDNQIIETPIYFLGITPNINITIKIK